MEIQGALCNNVMGLAVGPFGIPSLDLALKRGFGVGVGLHVAFVEMLFHQGLLKVKGAHLHLKGKTPVGRVQQPTHLMVVGFNVLDGRGGEKMHMSFTRHELLSPQEGGTQKDQKDQRSFHAGQLLGAPLAAQD